MASALFATWNEPKWGERKVYMRKNPKTAPATTSTSSSNPDPNSKPNPVANPNPNLATGEVSPRSEDCSSFNHQRNPHFAERNHHNHRRGQFDGDGGGRGYLVFNIGAFSRAELRDLKRRLVSELEQVRNLAGWIESRDPFPGARSTGFSASGSYGGVDGDPREATSSAAARSSNPRPPAHLDPSPANRPSGPKEMQIPKLPPSENPKKVSGVKRPPHLPTSPRDPKRPVAGSLTGEAERLLSTMMKKCEQILIKLMKHKHGWVFNVPVDVVGMGLHDYFQIVKRPMDLGSVKSNLDFNNYTSPSQFAADVRLTFNNALLYNPKGHDVYIMAEQLLRLFEDLFSTANDRYEKQRRAADKVQQFSAVDHAKRAEAIAVSASGPTDVATPARAAAIVAASIPRPAQRSPPQPPKQQQQQQQQQYQQEELRSLEMVRPVTGKQPKPKAKDPNPREMSLVEKQKLTGALESLPAEKMNQVIQIVKRRNPDPVLENGEVELDLEDLKTETLWELDRFVTNFKKAMSKIKRLEPTSFNAVPPPQASTDAATTTVDKVPTAVVGETPDAAAAAKKNRRVGGEAGEEDVDIGEEEIPSGNIPSLEIEKDNGYESTSSDSSSGSSSSSSSSDSDSGSSSDSDSDADEAQSPACALRPPP